MAAIIKDSELIGKRYGKLTILSVSPIVKAKHRYVVCRCDCGKEKTISLTHIRSGCSRSCGCGVKESTIKRNTTHGDTGSRLYNIWLGIKTRCYNSSDSSYENYGKRGITLCDEWQDYIAFKTWSLSHGYNDNLTIDRIDVNGNYCPTNCRWVDYYTQARNKRNNRKITINNETKIISDWIKESDISNTQVYCRLSKGWNIEDALYTPDRRSV